MIVVVGIIKQNGKYLIGLRTPHRERPNLWEFPGGKVEEGETPLEALRRELHEELEIWMETAVFFCNRPYELKENVELQFFIVNAYSGVPQCKVHIALRWVEAEDLITWPDFIDAEILKQLFSAKTENPLDISAPSSIE